MTIDDRRGCKRGKTLAKSRCGVARERKGDIGKRYGRRCIERCGMQRAPCARCIVELEVGPVDFVHACIECDEHARWQRCVVQARRLCACEERAHGHDRHVQAERQTLRDACRGAQSREGARTRAERDRRTFGKRDASVLAQLAHRGQQPRAGYRARRLVAKPDA